VKKTSQHKGDAITAFISYITKDKSYIIHGYRRKGVMAQWFNGFIEEWGEEEKRRGREKKKEGLRYLGPQGPQDHNHTKIIGLW
jgi:hypothetical protein